MEQTINAVCQYVENNKPYHKYQISFKNKHAFSKRNEEATRILKKYPGRIPIICECLGGEVPDIDRKKYLVPADLTMAQFLYVIRKRIKINPEKSIFIFVNDNIIAGSQLIGALYEQHKDLDGFLYTGYSGENTFG